MTYQGGGSADAFAEMARALLAEDDVQHTLQKICDLAVETIDGCDHAGISFLKGRKVDTPAASDDVPRMVDAIQYEVSEGPCLDAIRDHEVFETGDLGREDRWPHFASRAQRETGITSMLCFRLFVEGDTIGALNLYSKAGNAFGEESRTVGLVFAAHAAVALSSAIHDEQMEEALQSRDLIGQAKGILMAREGITADQAFDMLRRASQRLNVKLRDVAGGIVERSAAPVDDEGAEGDA
ncbi:MAG TPA: GAF and ANTAR domain-containing protein [Acidimicrobiales bacterium]|nr:GAF and ANTAR domain-containing protein [Acidimicrobiales bacterium]